MNEPQDEHQEQDEHAGRSEESFFLAHGAEDEVGVLLGYELQLRLCAVEKALTLQSARADGNLALVDVVAGTCQVFLQSEQHVDAHSLVGFHHIVEHVAGRIEEGDAAQCEGGDEEVVAQAAAQPFIDENADENGRKGQLHVDDVEGNDILGEEQRSDGDADGIGHEHEHALPVATIDAHHRGREHLHQQ